MMYRIQIVEDEPLIARRLQRLSGEILGDRLAGSSLATNVSEAEEQQSRTDFDMVLLDLNLAGEDGFSLLKRFTAKAAHTIVVSAQTERALEAFEYGVLDFVPKPFTRSRLEKAFTRLWDKSREAPALPKQLSFETHGGFDVVDLETILFFKAADKYSEAMLTNGKTRFHGKSLNSLEHILASNFIRTHKSYLVLKRAILDIRSLEGSRYALRLANGDQLPVGRTRVDHVRHILETRHAVT